VQTNLQKASRFVKTYQNLGKIPEAQISKIRTFNQARDDLRTKLGFDPDTHSLAEHLGWHPRQVVQLQRELRKDLPASSFAFDPAEQLHPRELEAVTLIQYGLSPVERSVYEHTFGMNGKSVLSPGQIASKVGIHPSKVSRIRNKLQDKVHEALQVL
jgi:DNA-directed RNA polymerase specialized sigma subunit